VNVTHDVILVNPTNQSGIYQGLASTYAAVEPPTWALLIAAAVRARGFSVALLDTNAEGLEDEEAVKRIECSHARLIVFVAYGQNVNAGTASMSGVSRLASRIRDAGLEEPIAVIGSYPQALPKKTLIDEPSIDFVFCNEGVQSLIRVLGLAKVDTEHLRGVEGLAVRHGGEVYMTPPGQVVSQDLMDSHLPGYAWDLLPYRSEPFDLYRAPLWHAGYDHGSRSPYAALQTSLGCQFKCSFCMINVINRDNTDEIGVAAKYAGMRFWSPEFVVQQIDRLAAMGVRTVRITDEMFLLNRKYYEPILRTLASRPYASEMRMWVYSRVDTIRDQSQLDLVRAAGIRWLCLGIESANREVRLEISKGKFQDVDIKEVVDLVHKADIDVLANYIVGLPGEGHKELEDTLNLSLELCTSGWNMYAAMALPGSSLYADAVANGALLPDSYEGYSFHSYETVPLANEKLSGAEMIAFRDAAFVRYHTDTAVLDRIQRRFGAEARKSVVAMTQYQMKRRLLGHS